MDFNLSEEQKMLQDGAERFIRENYSLEARRHLTKTEEGFSRDFWSQFAELGWLMLNVPESAGGLGAEFVNTAILMKCLGQGLVLEPYISTAVLGARILERADDSDAAAGILEEITKGALLLCLAHQESSGSVDPKVITTKATRKGESYVLEGAKYMALNAPSADILLVSARIENENDYALFLVDKNNSGVSLVPYPLINGFRAGDVIFERATVDAASRIVSGERAPGILSEAIDRATIAWLSYGVGGLEACLDTCREYVGTRKQFGQTIGKFQALQHILAEMFVTTQESHSILYQALSRIGADEASERSKAVSVAKIIVGGALHFVTGQAIQLHGGYGVTDEYSVSHFYKNALVVEQLFGDTDFHSRQFIAAEYANESRESP